MESKDIEKEKLDAWETKHIGLQNRETTQIIHNPSNPKAIFVGTYGNGLYRSTNRGKTWEPIGEQSIHEHIRAIHFSPTDGNTLYVGTEPAAIYQSTNHGTSWTDLGISKLPESHTWYLPYSPRAGAARTIAIPPDNPNHLYVGIEQGGLLTSPDGGKHWTLDNKRIHKDVHELALDKNIPRIIYAATGGGIFQSKNKGKTWNRLLHDYTRAIICHPLNTDIVFAGPAKGIGHTGRVLKSKNRGKNWSKSSNGLETPMEEMVHSFFLTETIPDKIFMISTNGHLYYSTIDPINWKKLHLIDESINSIDIVEI